jgi:hypothetical protein
MIQFPQEAEDQSEWISESEVDRLGSPFGHDAQQFLNCLS